MRRLFAHTIVVTALGLPQFAQAEEPDQVRLRADCAQESLARAMGEPVTRPNPACQAPRTTPPPSPSPARDVLPPMRVPAPVRAQPLDGPPRWVTRLPTEAGKVFGSGDGGDQLSAFQAAATVLAAQLQVQVRSTLTTQESAVRTRVGQVEQTAESASIHNASTLIVQAALDDVRIVDSFVAGNGRTHVLVSLDLEAIAKRKNAMVAAALAALSGPMEAIATELSAPGPVHQTYLLKLLDAVDDVQRLSASKLGRDAADGWRAQLLGARRVAGRLLGCVTAEPVEPVLGALNVPADLSVRVHCQGHPWSDARFVPEVTQGLAKLPPAVTTDSRGLAAVRVDRVLGPSTVDVAFVHAPDGLSPVWRSIPDGRLRLPTRATPTLRLLVQAPAVLDGQRIQSAVAVATRRRFGATETTAANADLQATIQIQQGPTVETYGKHSVAMKCTVLVTADGQVVFEKTAQSSFLGTSPQAAADGALASLLDRVQGL